MSRRIPETFTQELLARVDIVEVIRKYVPTLKHSGKDWMACCPFHQEKSPSFSVSQHKQFYYCFGCGASGNAIGFLMNYAHFSFVEAVESLALPLGMEIPEQAGGARASTAQWKDFYTILEASQKFYAGQLKKSPRAIDYLKKRGLSGEICKTFGIGYAPDEWDPLLRSFPEQSELLLKTGMIIQKDEGRMYDRFRDRIMFPIRDKQGRHIGFGGRVLDKGEPKYLNSPETVLFHKGAQVYGLHECLKANPHCTRVIVVEGYMDVVALAQFGICNAVATLGTALTSQHMLQLFQVAQEIIFCFDGDKAGRNAGIRAMEVGLPFIGEGKQIKFLFLPENEDPDSLVRNEGREKFLQRVAQSQNLSSMIMEHLISQVDLSSLDGRAHLADLAKPYLEKVSSEVYRSLLLEELSRYTRLDAGKLTSALKLVRQASIPEPSVSARSLSLYERAMSFLLKHPDWVHWMEAPEMFLPLNDPQVDLWVQLAQWIHNQAIKNTGQIFGLWPDEAKIPYLAELAAVPCMLSEKESEEEFKGLIVQLKKRLKEMEMTNLLTRAKTVGLMGLTESERDLIRSLLTDPGLS